MSLAQRRHSCAHSRHWPSSIWSGRSRQRGCPATGFQALSLRQFLSRFHGPSEHQNPVRLLSFQGLRLGHALRAFSGIQFRCLPFIQLRRV